MNWLKKLLGIRPRDFVVLRFNDNTHELKPVTWHCGVPFSAPYLPSTACELLPGGEVIGQSYIKAWLPATQPMQEFFSRSADLK